MNRLRCALHAGPRLAAVPLLALIIGAANATDLDDALNASPTIPFAEEFDCVNAFDLFVSFMILRCAAFADLPDDQTTIARALSRLQELKLVSDADTVQVEIRFCPLLGGTGLVPAPARVLLDDGLRAMSTDGLAEIIAHELVHVQQFETLGTAEFKCTYVRAMSACSGCQDRGHPLERVAYESQDRARNALRSASGDAPARRARDDRIPHSSAK